MMNLLWLQVGNSLIPFSLPSTHLDFSPYKFARSSLFKVKMQSIEGLFVKVGKEYSNWFCVLQHVHLSDVDLKGGNSSLGISLTK